MRGQKRNGSPITGICGQELRRNDVGIGDERDR